MKCLNQTQIMHRTLCMEHNFSPDKVNIDSRFSFFTFDMCFIRTNQLNRSITSIPKILGIDLAPGTQFEIVSRFKENDQRLFYFFP